MSMEYEEAYGLPLSRQRERVSLSAQQLALEGMEALTKAMKTTFGPRGHQVVLGERGGTPVVATDGVTVAREIELEGRPEAVGALIVKGIATTMEATVGDGATTATVLAEAIYRESLRSLTAGHNVAALRRGMEQAVDVVAAELGRLSTWIGDSARDRRLIAQVGTMAAKGDWVIGQLIAEAMAEVGKDGVIAIAEERGRPETTLEIVNGTRFEQGYISPHFITDEERREAVLEQAHILLHDQKISTIQPLMPILRQIADLNKPLLIVAADVEGEALATLVVNKLRQTLKCAAIKAPGYGDRRAAILEDLAALTGGTVISDARNIGLDRVTLADLGRATRVVVDHERTTIIGADGRPQDVASRAEQIRAQLRESSSDYEREKLQERLAKLVCGVAVITVSAATEAEVRAKGRQVENALKATRAALEGGVIPGGGVALIRCLPALDRLQLPGDEGVGVQIIRRALEEPIRQLSASAGAEGAQVARRVSAGKGAFGYNVATKAYEDLAAAGVIDPTTVVKLAVSKSAALVASILSGDMPTAPPPASEDASPTRPARVEPLAPTFYFILEGQATHGDVVQLGSDVDVVFNYAVPPRDVLVTLEGQQLDHVRRQDLDLGIAVLPKGFTFRDGRWYQTAKFRAGQLQEEVRFRLKAPEAAVEGAGFYIVFDVRGCVLYQLSVDVRLVPAMDPSDFAALTPRRIDLNLDELRGEQEQVEEAMRLMR